MSLTDSLAQAIARFEGFFTAGSVAARNNNPGNLRSGVGQIGTDPNGYAIFPDQTTGFQALSNQIQLNISRGLNLNEFFAGQRDAEGNVIPGGYPGYAPAADRNQPAQYASTVAGWLGIDPTAPLNTLDSGTAPSPPPLTEPSAPSSSDVLSSILGDTSGGISPVAIGALALVGLAALVVVTRS